ncbi:MAG: DUF5123 domain-containing protein [Niastella sp.]|nr:DUF5123 domain-containing protein [Niastella sp.]
MRLFLALLLSWAITPVHAHILHTGHGQPYLNITAAAKKARPGDTILVHAGTYHGDQVLQGLQGTKDRWIYILAEKDDAVQFKGGAVAWKASDIAYLHIEGFVFIRQTDNGLNIDDGGTYDSPAHHIVFRHCAFRDMAAKGNNDLLKLSGVDNFTLQQCTFLNGSAGGSGIDMVGCHDGLITQCRFENMGSNAVQAKGGSSNIRIEANTFKNAGSRSINLGGGTGLPFFRPANATVEATRLKVYSNLFIGSDVPVAFVGCTDSEVINNTIYKPGRWVLRILQENKDTIRFAKCSNNSFRNNLVYIDEQVHTVCNIGGGTMPQTFNFSNNLWFQMGNDTWAGPQLPTAETGAVLNKDPLFKNAAAEDFTLRPQSPAAGTGVETALPEKDRHRNTFRKRRSIGAFEVLPGAAEPGSDSK